MIFIKRPKTVPLVFNSPLMKKARKEILDFYKLSEKDRAQQKLPYVQLNATNLKQLRTALDKLFVEKCAYCESRVGHISYGDFDHFRPRTSARGLNKEFSSQHYGWLAYTWPNMYLSCMVCNKHKLNWFPVKTSRINPLTPYVKVIKEEEALLVDPCNENPELHFTFSLDGRVSGNTEKGNTTIELLNLNRPALVSDRKETLTNLDRQLSILKLLYNKKPHVLLKNQLVVLNSILSDISSPSPKQSFIAGQRQLIKSWLEKETAIRDFIFYNKTAEQINKKVAAVIGKQWRISWKTNISKFYSPTIKKTETLKKKATKGSLHKVITSRINLDRIEVKNFKAIEDIVIKFPQSASKYESWLMFLGENGVGKSSMLQAIALTLMGSKYFSKSGIRFKPKDILRHQTQEGSVKIFTKESEIPVEMNFSSRQTKIQHSHISPPSFLLAYGSTRLFKTGTFNEEVTQGLVKTKNMFDPSYALTDAKKWILGIKDEKLFDKVAIAIKDLLLFSNKERLIRQGGKVYIHYGTKPPDTLDELSDGYKSVIAVTVDIMRTLVQANTTMEVAEGLVLLDEIGTHLHPRWRMEIVKRFRNVFPRLQFIVTTHDPLCLRGLKAGEVIVFNKDKKHMVYAMCDLPDPSEFRVDQLLNSEFFGLNSTIDPSLEKEFNEYYELLRNKDILTVKQQERLKKLQSNLSEKRHLGNSLREELAFEAVDTLLAEKSQLKEAPQREQLKNEAVIVVKNMWDKIMEGSKK